MTTTLDRRRAIAFLVAAATVLAAVRPATAKEALKPSDGAKRAHIWKDAIAAFEKQDAESPAEPGMVLFVGSSSVRLWDLPKWFPDLPVLNRGFGGSTIIDAVHFVDTLVLKHQPAVIVLYSGDNDLAGGLSAEQVHRDFQEFVKVVRKELPETPIVYMCVKACTARWKNAEEIKEANGLIAAQCAKDDSLTYVDVWDAMLDADGQPRPDLLRDDGLHMVDAGYQIWVDQLRPVLDKLLKSQRQLQAVGEEQ